MPFLWPHKPWTHHPNIHFVSNTDSLQLVSSLQLFFNSFSSHFIACEAYLGVIWKYFFKSTNSSLSYIRGSFQNIDLKRSAPIQMIRMCHLRSFCLIPKTILSRILTLIFASGKLFKNTVVKWRHRSQILYLFCLHHWYPNCAITKLYYRSSGRPKM